MTTALTAPDAPDPQESEWAAYRLRLPRDLLRHVDMLEDSDLLAARESPTHAAAMLIDGAGFTALTQALARFSDGAEQIGALLAEFFRLVLPVVDFYGGDCLLFLGDAVLVAWFCPEDGLQAAALSALECSQRLTAPEVAYPQWQGAVLEPHIGIGMGPCSRFILGSSEDWRHMVLGHAITEASWACASSGNRQCVITGSVYHAVRQYVRGKEQRGVFQGVSNVPYYIVESASPSSPRSRRRDPGFAVDPPVVTEAPSPALAAVMRRFLTRAERRAPAETGGQLRVVTTVFIKLRDLGEEASFVELQQAVQLIFAELAKLDGVCLKVMQDDKGCTALCLFGLPLHVRENEAESAVVFALRVLPRLEDVVGRVAVGITRGEVFCGTVGNKDLRCSYDVLGHHVNLAARLMSVRETGSEAGPAAKSRVLCDEATFVACRNGCVAFGDPRAVALKGLGDPTTVYEAIAIQKIRRLSIDPSRRDSVDSVGQSRRDSCGMRTARSMHLTSSFSSRKCQSPKNVRVSLDPPSACHSNPLIVRTKMELDDLIDLLPGAPVQRLMAEVTPRSQLLSPKAALPASPSRCRSDATAQPRLSFGLTSSSSVDLLGAPSAGPMSQSPSTDTHPSSPHSLTLSTPHSLFRLGSALSMLPEGAEGALEDSHLIERGEPWRAIQHLVCAIKSRSSSLDSRALWEGMRPDESATRVVVVQGEAGLGKTLLIEKTRDLAFAGELKWVMTKGSAVDESSPFGGLRAMVEELLESPEDVKAYTHSLPPPLAGQVALLRTVFDCIPYESALYMEGGVRRAAMDQAEVEMVMDLLDKLLLWEFGSSPFLLVVDDAHWLDHHSWDFLLRTLATMARCYAVFALRSSARRSAESGGPLPAAAPGPKQRAFCTALLDQVPGRTFTLQPFSPRGAKKHYCNLLGVTHCETRLRELLYEHSGGNPGVAEQLVSQLLDINAIKVVGGRALLSHAPGAGQTLGRLEQLLAARIDELPGEAAHVLRVASIVGQEFRIPLLAHCVGMSEAQTRELCQLLMDDGFLDAIRPFSHASSTMSFRIRNGRPETSSRIGNHFRKFSSEMYDREATAVLTPKSGLSRGNSFQRGSFVFRMAALRKAVYATVLYKTRREVHLRVAEWLEEHGEGCSMTLAHHYRVAAEGLPAEHKAFVKACLYLERAAYDNYAHQRWAEGLQSATELLQFLEVHAAAQSLRPDLHRLAIALLMVAHYELCDVEAFQKYRVHFVGWLQLRKALSMSSLRKKALQWVRCASCVRAAYAVAEECHDARWERLLRHGCLQVAHHAHLHSNRDLCCAALQKADTLCQPSSRSDEAHAMVRLMGYPLAWAPDRRPTQHKRTVPGLWDCLVALAPTAATITSARRRLEALAVQAVGLQLQGRAGQSLAVAREGIDEAAGACVASELLFRSLNLLGRCFWLNNRPAAHLLEMQRLEELYTAHDHRGTPRVLAGATLCFLDWSLQGLKWEELLRSAEQDLPSCMPTAYGAISCAVLYCVITQAWPFGAPVPRAAVGMLHRLGDTLREWGALLEVAAPMASLLEGHACLYVEANKGRANGLLRRASMDAGNLGMPWFVTQAQRCLEFFRNRFELEGQFGFAGETPVDGSLPGSPRLRETSWTSE
eukprot:EG_transcript_135